jgi:hypothetical protein
LDLRAKQGDYLLLSRTQVQELAVDDQAIVPDQQDVQSFEVLKDPANGWRLGGLPFLVWEGSFPILERLSELPFRQRVNQESQSHHHHQGHEPFRLLQEQAVGKKERIF